MKLGEPEMYFVFVRMLHYPCHSPLSQHFLVSLNCMNAWSQPINSLKIERHVTLLNVPSVHSLYCVLYILFHELSIYSLKFTGYFPDILYNCMNLKFK